MQATKTDFEAISKIANRAIEAGLNIHSDKLSLVMDIECANDTIPLRLNALLCASEYDFAHDICGIQRHLNRATRQIEDFFVPRYSK